MVKGQSLGHGSAPFWKKRVTVASLSESKNILAKHGFQRSKVSLQELVPWESLANQPWSKGPALKELLLLPMGWKQYLVVVYEVLLHHLSINSECHATKRNSSLEFISPTPKKKKPVEQLRRALKGVEKDVSFEEEPRILKKRAPVNKEIQFLSQSSEDLDGEVFTQPFASGSPIFTQPSLEICADPDTGLFFLPPGQEVNEPGSSSTLMEEEAAAYLTSHGVFTQPEKLVVNLPAFQPEQVPNTGSGSLILPVFKDWEKYGDLFDTLSEWAPRCKVQVVSVEQADRSEVPKLLLYDRETSIMASLNPKYKTDIKFLKPGSLLELWSTSGTFDHLVIVSSS